MYIEIPSPTGFFGVGKSIHHVIDTNRNEKYNLGNNRELLIYIYYPTDQKSKSAYAPDIISFVKEKIYSLVNGKEIDTTYMDSLKEHTALNVSLSSKIKKFPVLFFFPGLGEAVETYTTLLEEMASHGYIVIAINPPYGVNPTVFPDGRVVKMNTELANFWYVTHRPFEEVLEEEHEYWLQDAHFVINLFKNISDSDSYHFLQNKIDYNAMGFWGHSFGGSLAVQVCRERKDIKACVNLDGIIFGPLNKRLEVFDTPNMFILMDGEPTDEELIQSNITRFQYDQLVGTRHPRLLYDNLQSNAYFIKIKNSNHYSFSDFSILSYSLTPHRDPLKCMSTVRILLLQFFNRYLKNEEMNAKVVTDLPEIIFESKGF